MSVEELFDHIEQQSRRIEELESGGTQRMWDNRLAALEARNAELEKDMQRCSDEWHATEDRCVELEGERDEGFTNGVRAAFRWVKNLPKEDDEVAKRLFDEALARPDVQASLLKARIETKTTGGE